MIILHFDLQPQFKHMNYFIYTSHHDILYIIVSQNSILEKKSNHSVSSLILKQIICIDIRENVSRKQNKRRDFFREVNGSVVLPSPYTCTGTCMQIRVNRSKAFCPQRCHHKTFTFTFGSQPLTLPSHGLYGT